MAEFKNQEFFGGSIRGVVPKNWIDASTLREIPDHQELFLSPSTLSNLIIEINQRVSAEDALSTFATLSQQQPTLAAEDSAASATPNFVDKAAALYHLNDLCDEGDSMQVVTLPQRVSPGRLAATAPPGSQVTMYKGVVLFLNAPRQRGGQFAPVSATNQPTKLTCHYLIVRLESQETDLLVFSNVPHEEFEKAGNVAGLNGEETVAEDTVSALVEKIEICDWGLFV
ncbi:hypothetical protein N7495_003604 [Penicillium taxi]|uniref:uncharacterized protein n=1 Tax=Penicillium taxi TaxID=168475 RepID=UPI002545261B|nr:uncharacterized protein N7495_003604 [Penicillium taxi]KAJ5898860.1 hypothetical protein N7495_003604 [Penicillium taxi]